MARRVVPAQFIFGFEWNFAKDGGTQGVYETRITIPVNHLVFFSCFQRVVTLVGAGSSVLVGVAGSTNLYSSYPAAAYGLTGFNVSKGVVSTGAPVVMEIFGADLTAGHFICFIQTFNANPNG